MQLGKLLESVYTRCGLQFLRGTATGGSATTVVDTRLINRKPDGYFAQGANGGHILFITQTTDRLSPEGKYAEVTSFTLSTSTPTFTFSTLTDAVGAGDIYAVMKPFIQLQEMIAILNSGLARLTDREKTDTSLTSAASTLAYALPLPINRYNIQKIEIGNNTNGWSDAPPFQVVPASGGTTDTLLFTHQPAYDRSLAANQTIKITYRAVHPTLSLYSDYVEKSIPDELAIAVCAEMALEYLMNKRPSYFTNKTRMEMYRDAMQRAQQAKLEHPLRTEPARRQNRLDLRSM